MKRIPLWLSGGPNIDYYSWPVTQGVPFADGELENPAAVRVVDATDRAFPTQSRCLTTWNKNLKYVKWLLVDFHADLQAGRKHDLFLEYGPDVRVPTCEQAIQVTEGQNRLTVDTGALRLELRNTPMGQGGLQAPEDCGVFARCTVKGKDSWHDIFAGNPGPFLYMRDQHGNSYNSHAAAPRPQISVEEAGPLRACICIKGHHATVQGVRFCPYILRIHLFAGKSDMRIYHTFIFDQEPHFVELSAVGMKFPLNLGKCKHLAVAGEGQAHTSNECREMQFLQTDDLTYTTSADGRTVDSGEKTSGWVMITGSLASALAVVKDLWQEYPKAFAVTSDGIDVQIWPEGCGSTLKFTTPFEEPAIYFNGTRDEQEFKRLLEERPTAPLNLKSCFVKTTEDLLWVEKMLEKYAPDRTASLNDTWTDNGIGAAKTTEMFLRLAPTSVGTDEAETLALAVQEPLIAPVEPKYTCATKALGHFYHAGDPRFIKIDRGLDMLLRQVAIEPTQTCRLYGMMRYGNMVCSHAPGPTVSYVRYKDTEPQKALRYAGSYNNEANDQIMGVWGNFIRTGRREHYFLAQAYSRTIADVCIVHAHPSNPSVVGLMHYHNAHQWSGEPSPSHTLISGIMADYYFTGNRRLLEVARETADWAVRTQEPCGIISDRNWPLHREVTGPLWRLLDVYQATWEQKYADVAERSLNWFLRTLPQAGKYPVSVYTRGERGDEAVVEPTSGCTGHSREVYYLLEIALRLFDSKTLREQVLAEADYCTWDALTDNYVTKEQARNKLDRRSLLWPVDNDFYWTNWAHDMPSYLSSLVCLAYDLTGDAVYAAYAKDHLMGTFLRQVERCKHFADWRFTWLLFGSYIPRLMRIVADAMDKDPDALAKAEQQWRQKRAEMDNPVYTGLGVDLTKDTMDTNGNITSRSPVDLPREAPPRSREPVTNLGKISTKNHPES
ncbi:MAG: hypothetical protein ABIG61_12715 [Planctomycetota bacterium]